MKVVYSLKNMFLKNKPETAAVVTNFIVLEFYNFIQKKKILESSLLFEICFSENSDKFYCSRIFRENMFSEIIFLEIPLKICTRMKMLPIVFNIYHKVSKYVKKLLLKICE